MVDQDENESGNPGHTHPGVELLLWKGVFYRERGEERVKAARPQGEGVPASLTDFSESEEDLSSDDPEQEGAALDVRSAKRNFMPQSSSPSPRISLKKTHTTDRTQTKETRKGPRSYLRFRPAPMMRS